MPTSRLLAVSKFSVLDEPLGAMRDVMAKLGLKFKPKNKTKEAVISVFPRLSWL